MKRALIALSLATAVLLTSCAKNGKNTENVQSSAQNPQINQEQTVPMPENGSLIRSISGGTDSIPDKIIKDSYSPGADLSDDIYSFQLQIFDDVYKFPISYEDFILRGWKPDGAENSITAFSEGFAWFRNGDIRMCFRIYNPDAYDHVYKDCYISGISTFIGGTSETNHIFIPGGFQMGKATKNEISAAYGEPDEVEVSPDSSEVIYNYVDVNDETVFSMRFDSNSILDALIVGNSITPDGFVMTPASPDVKIEYIEPAQITDNIQDCIVVYEGNLYVYPAPVQAFIDNGCKYVPDYEGSLSALFSKQLVLSLDDSLSAYSNSSINIKRHDIRLVSKSIINPFNEPCLVKNALVDDDLSVSEISGGIKLGMTSEELVAILEKNEIEYTHDTSYGDRYRFTLDKSYVIKDYTQVVSVSIQCSDEATVEAITVSMENVY